MGGPGLGYAVLPRVEDPPPTPLQRRERSEAAAISLAKMMNRELGCNIDANALRMFLIARWSYVSGFAHRIHDNDVAVD